MSSLVWGDVMRSVSSLLRRNSARCGGFWRLTVALIWGIALCLLGSLPAWCWSWPAGGRDTLVIASADEFREMNPALVLNLNCHRALAFIYEPLVKPGNDIHQVQPGLALSWQSNNGGKSWRFNLRPHVFLHDGRELTAELAAESLTRCFGREGHLNGSYPFHQVMLLDRGHSLFSQVKAVDRYTLQVELRKPLAGFLDILAHPAMAIAVPAARGASREDLVGTGPFYLEERRPGQRLVLGRFERYWHHRPTWRKVILLSYSGARERQRALCGADVDMCWGLDNGELDELKKRYGDKLQFVPHPGRAYWSVALNCSQRPFSDIRCRLALQYASDKNRLVKRFSPSRAAAACGVVPWGSWALPKSVPGYAYDSHKARRLSDRVFGTNDRELELLYSDDNFMGPTGELAQFLQSEWQIAGIEARPRRLQLDEYLNRLSRGAFAMALILDEHVLGDPDLDIRPHWDVQCSDGLVNIARFSSVRLDQRLSEARFSSKLSTRQCAYASALKQLHDEAAELPLVWIVVVSAYDKRLENVHIDRYNMFDVSEARFAG